MRVEVGPVPSSSARAWVRYARTVVEDLQDASEDVPPPVPPEALDAFVRYLDDWDAAARRHPVFRWSGDLDAEAVEYLLHAWFTLAERQEASARRRGVSVAPAEGTTFYRAVVSAVLDALESEGASSAQFSAHLRSFWPGLAEPPF